MDSIQKKLLAQRTDYSTISISGIGSLFFAAKFTMMFADLVPKTTIKQNENRSKSK